MDLNDIFKKGCEERTKWLETAKENMRKSLKRKSSKDEKNESDHADGQFTVERLERECYSYYDNYEKKYLNGGQIYRVARKFHYLPHCSSSAIVSIEGDCLNLINDKGDYLLTDEEAKRGTWIAQITENKLNDLLLWYDVNTGNENVFTIKSYGDRYGGIGYMLRSINLPKDVKYDAFTTYYAMLTYMCDGIYRISVPSVKKVGNFFKLTGPGSSSYLEGIYDIINDYVLVRPLFDGVSLTDKGFCTYFIYGFYGPRYTYYESDPEGFVFFPVHHEK